MEVAREQIVAEARKWLGTPWVHGVTDCAQLVMNVGKDLSAFRPGALEDPFMRQFDGYPETYIPKRMIKALNFLLVRTDETKLGDVCLFFIKGSPQHLGIISRRPGDHMYIIHGFNKPSMMMVVESRIINPGHILGTWQFPMVEK